jgi:hypothetical protein
MSFEFICNLNRSAKKLRDMVQADLKKAMVQYEGIIPAYQEPALLKNRAHSAGA